MKFFNPPTTLLKMLAVYIFLWVFIASWIYDLVLFEGTLPIFVVDTFSNGFFFVGFSYFEFDSLIQPWLWGCTCTINVKKRSQEGRDWENLYI